MKVKCIDASGYHTLTLNKVYNLKHRSEFFITIKDDRGIDYSFRSHRFEIVPEQTLEQQLQTAKNKVKEIEAQIEAAKPKVGQKYCHRLGSHWMLCSVSDGYCLICIKDNDTDIDLGCAYAEPTPNISGVFAGFSKNFTLLP